MQLVAYGAQDIYLTGNPQITFFKVVYRRHTNFSMETISQTLDGNGSISSSQNEASCTIARNGDLIYKMYITSSTSNIHTGSKIISSVELEIGGQKIDKHTAEWNDIWNELSIPDSKSHGLKCMQCDDGGISGKETSGVGLVQIPLNFWFCRNPGLALPLIALQYHEVKINFVFGTVLEVGTSAKLKFYVDYIYLDTDERKRFAQVSHEYLIEQVQMQRIVSDRSQELTFNHPVKELIWTSAYSKTHNYGTAILKLNGLDRFEKQEEEYFQLRQPFDYHTTVPRTNLTLHNHIARTRISVHNLLKNDVHIGVGSDATAEQDGLRDAPLINSTGSFGSHPWDSNTFVIANNSGVDFAGTASPIVQPLYCFQLEDFSESNINKDFHTAGEYEDGSFLKVHDKLLIIGSGTKFGPHDTTIDSIETEVVMASSTNPDINISSNFYTKGTDFSTHGRKNIYFELGTNIYRDISSYSNVVDGPAEIKITAIYKIVTQSHSHEAYTSKLDKKINVYSFALKPEEHQPSGTCNFSRIDTAILEFGTAPTNSSYNIYAVNYNVLRIMSGMGGLAYSN